MAILNDLSREINDANKQWGNKKGDVPVEFRKATLIALMHSELSEMLEGVRKGIMDEHLKTEFQEDVELADLIIRALDYAGEFKIDIDGLIMKKLVYNAVRADHKPENMAKPNGKKF